MVQRRHFDLFLGQAAHVVKINDFEAILNNFWTTPPKSCPEWGRVGQNHMVIPLEGCQRNSREGLFKASTRLYAVLGWSPSRPHGRANITVLGVRHVFD